MNKNMIKSMNKNRDMKQENTKSNQGEPHSAELSLDELDQVSGGALLRANPTPPSADTLPVDSFSINFAKIETYPRG